MLARVPSLTVNPQGWEFNHIRFMSLRGKKNRVEHKTRELPLIWSANGTFFSGCRPVIRAFGPRGLSSIFPYLPGPGPAVLVAMSVRLLPPFIEKDGPSRFSSTMYLSKCR